MAYFMFSVVGSVFVLDVWGFFLLPVSCEFTYIRYNSEEETLHWNHQVSVILTFFNEKTRLKSDLISCQKKRNNSRKYLCLGIVARVELSSNHASGLQILGLQGLDLKIIHCLVSSTLFPLIACPKLAGGEKEERKRETAEVISRQLYQTC